MAPSLIIFDMAGTTVRDDRFVHETIAQVLRAEGLAPSDTALDEVMGLPKPIAIAQLLEHGGEASDAARVARLHEQFLTAMLDFYRNDPRVSEIPGTTALFERLRAQGIRIATDTGFSRDIADLIIGRLGWADLLDSSICSDEVAQGRPDPEMGRVLIQRLGILDPATVLKVGDTASDMQMGRALGCGWIVGVTSGSLDEAALRASGATHILPSVSTLDQLWDTA